MRNLLIASAAKENGAERVVLVEPDLFFSAQDRGPHSTDHPQMTGPEAYKKFDGQPASAHLYAQMLRGAGVDQVVAVHNHKPEVLQKIYDDVYGTNGQRSAFFNLDIAYLVAHYILQVAKPRGLGDNVGLVAPDQGAADFVRSVQRYTGLRDAEVVVLEKQRHGQRSVEMRLPENAPLLKDREVFILDDMVRTGGTIAKAASLLHADERTRPRRIYFYCTHTYISPEARENLHAGALTEFATTNTLPNVLNRDDQGRLRQKIVVLKIEAFLADAILHCLEGREDPAERATTRCGCNRPAATTNSTSRAATNCAAPTAGGGTDRCGCGYSRPTVARWPSRLRADDEPMTKRRKLPIGIIWAVFWRRRM